MGGAITLKCQRRIQDKRRGRRSHRVGGANSQGSYVSKILNIEMKESGPLGPPRSANECFYNINWPEKRVFDHPILSAVALVHEIDY